METSILEQVKVVINHNAYPDNTHVFNESDCISRVVLSGAEWEPHICEMMARLYVPGTDLVDIGANLGLNTLSLHKRKPITGTCHLFEPQANVFALMAYNTQHIPNRKVYNMCLSNKPTVLRFRQQGFNVGATQMLGDGGLTGVFPPEARLVTVSAVPLDMVELDIKNGVSLVKIDVEGTEEFVLEGAKEFLRKYKPALLIEIWECNRATAFAKLAALGYQQPQHIGGDDYVAFPSP